MSELWALPAAFLAGVLTILSPCVLPLAPIVIAGSRARDPRGPLALAAGLALTFGIVGGALASLGVEFGADERIRSASAVIMIAAGLVMAVPGLAARLERVMAPALSFADGLQRGLPAAGLAGAAASGVVLAFAWAPCAGPTLGAAFALAAGGGTLLKSMLRMAVFAFGAAGALLVVGYGLGRLTSRGRKAAGLGAAIGRSALGIAFMLVGGAIVTGLDHRLEASAIAAMPDWLTSFATQL